MPSYIMHLACAKQIINIWKPLTLKEQNQFYLGSVIADACTEKRRTHFWDDETYRKLERKPNLDNFLAKYGNQLDDPFIFGYFAHLYLDRAFLERYWETHFLFFDECFRSEDRYECVDYVKVVEQNHTYNRKHFFSDELYYGDYDRMNVYFAQKYRLHIPDLTQTLEQKSGLSPIDELDWDEIFPGLDRMKECLKQTCEKNTESEQSSLKIFKLQELENVIEEVAHELVRGEYRKR